MFRIAAKLQVDGVAKLVKRLQAVDARVAKKGLRRAVDQSSRPVLAEARQLVPEDTKALKKALGRKTKSYKAGSVAVALVGPRRDASPKEIARAKARGRKIPKPKHRRSAIRAGRTTAMMVNPVLYAHLVEFGRLPVAIKNKKVLSDSENVFGKRVKAAKAHPFLRPALDKSEGVVRSTMVSVLREALLANGG